MMNKETAILFVMDFYSVTREVALQLYHDEIDAYISLISKLEKEKNNVNYIFGIYDDYTYFILYHYFSWN